MNSPSNRDNPDKLTASTDMPRTRWVSVASGRLNQRAGEAYLNAQARGFRPGHELDTWLCLMAEISQRDSG